MESMMITNAWELFYAMLGLFWIIACIGVTVIHLELERVTRSTVDYLSIFLFTIVSSAFIVSLVFRATDSYNSFVRVISIPVL